MTQTPPATPSTVDLSDAPEEATRSVEQLVSMCCSTLGLPASGASEAQLLLAVKQAGVVCVRLDRRPWPESVLSAFIEAGIGIEFADPLQTTSNMRRQRARPLSLR